MPSLRDHAPYSSNPNPDNFLAVSKYQTLPQSEKIYQCDNIQKSQKLFP